MTIAPVVIKSRSTPFFSMACAILVIYFVIKWLVLGGDPGVFSLIMGGVAAVVGLWWLWRARQAAVIVDGDQFTVIRRGRSQTYSRGDVASVDLSSLDNQVTFVDGTGTRLPLEGKELVHAGVLLTPPRRGRSLAPGSR